MQEIQEALDYILSQGIEKPEIGIVLGTGLGGLVEYVDVEKTIPYSEIPHFPNSTVETHHGQLLFGSIKGKKVVVMQGRFHYYEGYTAKQIAFPIRVMKCLGIEQVLISNASGAINPDYNKGDLVILDDHINLQFENPLRGTNIDELGPRFPDMSCPYDKPMRAILVDLAKQNGIAYHEGVYAAWQGPCLETRAEYRMLRTLGADLVGMSTVPEVIAAKHMNLPCVVVSVLTDVCDPDNLTPVTLEEIIAVAQEAEPKLIKLFIGLIEKL